jgi:hypothetical protein
MEGFNKHKYFKMTSAIFIIFEITPDSKPGSGSVSVLVSDE